MDDIRRVWSSTKCCRASPGERLAEYCDVFCEPSCFRWTRRAGFAGGAAAGTRACACTPISSAPDEGAHAGGGDGRGHGGPSGSPRGRRGWQRCERRACSRCCCRHRSTISDRATIRRRAHDRSRSGRWCWPRTSIRARRPRHPCPWCLSLAATQMKMTPAEAITAATINAAYSLRRGDEIGSLEAGQAGGLRHPRLRRLPGAPLLLRARSGARRIYRWGLYLYNFRDFNAHF